MSGPSNIGTSRMESLQSSQILKFLLASGIAALAAFILGQVLSTNGGSPIAELLLIVGLILMFYALVRPWNALLLFLWLVICIDALKRVTYAATDMSMIDVAEILIVPVLLMGGLYLRVFGLHWFVSRREDSTLNLRKFWPILVLFISGVGGLIYKEGASFGVISANYQIFCYIPAAVIVPYFLNSPERWDKYAQQLYYLLLVVGVYGIIQSIHGPFDYEVEYLKSGLTSTISLMEQESFRAFSLLNTGPTYAGMMIICLFYTYYLVCQKWGRMVWTLRVTVLTIFAAGACFLATQRGALISGLIVIVGLPMFVKPRMLIGLFVGFIVSYGLTIYYASEIKDYMYVADAQLDFLRTSHFMSQEFSILTMGTRLDGFIALQSPNMWTPLGGYTGEAGHNLLSDLLTWVGYIGTTVFLIIVGTVIYVSTRVLTELKHNPQAYLWAQVNLAVFLYVLIWGAFLGSTIHVSPVNFFFWTSLGNLIFLYRNRALVVTPEQVTFVPLHSPDELDPRHGGASLVIR